MDGKIGAMSYVVEVDQSGKIGEKSKPKKFLMVSMPMREGRREELRLPRGFGCETGKPRCIPIAPTKSSLLWSKRKTNARLTPQRPGLLHLLRLLTVEGLSLEQAVVRTRVDVGPDPTFKSVAGYYPLDRGSLVPFRARGF